jgi:predicted DNA binding protein
MEVLSVLKSEGNKHTLLVRGEESLDPGDSYKDLDLDLIWTKPSMISEDRITVSCIGIQDSLMRFIDLVKTHVGTIANMSFQKAAYQNQDILKALTERQREVVTAAHRYGYYKYPRKINTEVLSKKVNLSRATLVEHLRKAEVRILDEILTGYS